MFQASLCADQYTLYTAKVLCDDFFASLKEYNKNLEILYGACWAQISHGGWEFSQGSARDTRPSLLCTGAPCKISIIRMCRPSNRVWRPHVITV